MHFDDLSFGEALNVASQQALALDNRVFVCGLGVDGATGVFGTTKGLREKFEGRCFDTPVSEQAVTAMVAGAANHGLLPVLVHQRLDFMLYTMDQIVNWIALWRFKSAGKSEMPLVIRMIVGKGWGQGPQHAKSLQSWFSHIPGLVTVVPSSPIDAKGLLLSSIFVKSPVMFIEYRSLYSMREMVPQEVYLTPLGKARLRRSGSHLSIVTYGAGVPLALQVSDQLELSGFTADVIDLRTIAPYDRPSVTDSVRKTGRLLVLDSGWESFGVGREIIGNVVSDPECFSALKAPPKSVGWPDSHVPMASGLEEAYYPRLEDVLSEALELLHS